jgi:prefoldin subunit 5
MHCGDPNCGIHGPHDHLAAVEAVMETLRQQLNDFERENACLREAISDAWETYNKCQETLTEAQAQVQELSTQNRMLSQYLMDTSVGFECLSGCGANGHEAMCPVSNPVAAWRLIRDQVQELTSQLDQARTEVKELERVIEGLDPPRI